MQPARECGDRLLGLGIGWRPELALAIDRREDLGFVELLAENVDPRAPFPATLRRLRERGVKLVVHSIGLSLGGAAPVDGERLDRLARVAEWAGAVCASDHVAFVRAGGRGTGHLLPVPRTEASLDVLCANVARARAALPVPLALENIAALFDWPGATMDEPELLGRVTAATGALLVVDTSNLYANARNLGVDARAWLDRLPLERIAYAHVGGGVARSGVWHDTHAHAVPEGALALLRALGERTPLAGVMLERDDRFPPEAEVNRELDALAGAIVAAGRAARPAPSPPQGAPSAATNPAEIRALAACPRIHGQAAYADPTPCQPALAPSARPLAAEQSRLVGALVAGEPAPPGFDAERLRVETEALLDKRLRTAARAFPRADLEGALRARFRAWARANPPGDDPCGHADGRSFLATVQAPVGGRPARAPSSYRLGD